MSFRSIVPAVLGFVLLAGPSDGQEKKPQPKPAAPPPKAAPAEKPVTFEELYKAAAADLATVAPEERPSVRYFDARPFRKEFRKKAFGVFSYHVNSISREAELGEVTQVEPWLWRVNIGDYGWPAEVYENLAKVNFYHTLQAEIRTPVVTAQVKTETVVEKKPVQKTRKVLVANGRGGYVEKDETYTDYEEVRVEKKVETPVAVKEDVKKDTIPAPWVPAAEAALLMRELRTRVPIFRADQFINRTAIQKKRDGFGYYDFLGFKKRADVEKFAEFDKKKAIAIKKELAAIVPESGVSLNGRQIFRFPALTGPWWETWDFEDNDDDVASEVTGSRFELLKPKAFEIVFTLRNGLPGFYLADDKDAQQDTAPDFIAANRVSTNNDHRVHVGMSCIVCHFEGGLRPMRDWARQVYDAERGIAIGTLALDDKLARRTKQAYLGPLFENYKKDSDAFSEVIVKVTGFKKAEDLSAAFAEVWAEYLDQPVTLEKAAWELGAEFADVRQTLIQAAQERRILDTVLASYTVAPAPLAIRRELFERRFARLMLILGGLNP